MERKRPRAVVEYLKAGIVPIVPDDGSAPSSSPTALNRPFFTGASQDRDLLRL